MRDIFAESEKVRLPALKWIGLAVAVWIGGVFLVAKLGIGPAQAHVIWILISILGLAELIIGSLVFKSRGVWRILSIAAWLPVPAVLAIPYFSQEENLTLAAVGIAALPLLLYLPALYLLHLTKKSVDVAKGVESTQPHPRI